MRFSNITSFASRSSDGRLRAACGFGSEEAETCALFAPAAALAAALAALPLLFHVVVDSDRAVALAFLPAVWLGWKIVRPAPPFLRMVLLGAAGAAVLSIVFAPHAARALVRTATAAWVIAGAAVARHVGESRPAARLLVVGLATGAVLGMLTVLGGYGADWMSVPTYGSARLFAAHQFFGAAATLYFLVAAPPARRLLHALVVAAALVIWTGLAWAGARAPILGLAAFLGLWFWRAAPLVRRRLLVWVPVLALAGLAFSAPLGAPYPQFGWQDAFSRTVEATDLQTASSDRTRFWAATWHEILRSPWIGLGADSYLYIRPTQNGSQPHNVALQWWLEYGILGAVPLALLLLAGLRPLVARGRDGEAPTDLVVWAAAALGGAIVYGLFEGIFYHLIAFMPVAAIAGIALSAWPAQPRPAARFSSAAIARPTLLACLCLLLLHNGIYVLQIRGRNVAPDSGPARIVRAFPSTTTGLQNWIERWRRTEPAVAMEWIQWAQTASTEPAKYHLYAAQLHIWEKDFKMAEAELLRCLDAVHYLERPDVLAAIATVRKLAAEQQANDEARNLPSIRQAPSTR